MTKKDPFSQKTVFATSAKAQKFTMETSAQEEHAPKTRLWLKRDCAQLVRSTLTLIRKKWMNHTWSSFIVSKKKRQSGSRANLRWEVTMFQMKAPLTWSKCSRHMGWKNLKWSGREINSWTLLNTTISVSKLLSIIMKIWIWLIWSSKGRPRIRLT